MPHAGATAKTVGEDLGLGSLALANAAAPRSLDLQIFVFLHDFVQFLVHHDDLL